LYGRHAAADPFDRFVQLVLTAPCDVDIGALGDEALCRRQTNAAVCAGDDGDLLFKPAHGFLAE